MALKLRKLLAAGMAAVLVAPAHAEVLPVSGIYPAQSDDAAALRSIAITPFDGDDGPVLAFEIEDRLAKAVVDGERWFAISSGGADAAAEAELRGTAQSELEFEDYAETREECVRDDADKCTDAKRKFEVRCTHRTITLVTNVRLYTPDGTLIWSGKPSPAKIDSFCEDQQRPAGRREVVRGLLGDAAGTVWLAFVPHRRSATIRVNETRKGLDKELARRFRNAVRLTKTDWPAACREWDAIGQAAPDHVPTLFNRGLCGEARGDDAVAASHYRRLLDIAPGGDAPRDGLGRISVRDRARAQIAAHARD